MTPITPDRLARWLRTHPLIGEGESHGAATCWLAEFLVRQGHGEDIEIIHRKHFFQEKGTEKTTGANTYFFRWRGEPWWVHGPTDDEALVLYAARRTGQPFTDDGTRLWENTWVDFPKMFSGEKRLGQAHWKATLEAAMTQDHLADCLPEAPLPEEAPAGPRVPRL